MTYKEALKLNKAELCWLSFISGLGLYRNNQLLNIVIDKGNFILITVHLINISNDRHIEWRYRFNIHEQYYADSFISMVESEFPGIEIDDIRKE